VRHPRDGGPHRLTMYFATDLETELEQLTMDARSRWRR